MTASEAKLHFGDVLNRCVYVGEEITITRHDKPIAVVVGIGEWKRLKASAAPAKSVGDDDKDMHPLLRRILANRQKMWDSMSPAARRRNIDAVKLIRMIRDEDEDE